MIAAKDPQEFIPSGRQQLLRHPGTIDDPNPKQIEHENLLSSFERVSLIESKDCEWWTVREYAYPHANKPQSKRKAATERATFRDSWSWKTSTRRTSEGIQLKFIHSARNLADTDSGTERKSLDGDDNCDAPRLLNRKRFGVIEEELYVKDKVVVWTRGLNSVGVAQTNITSTIVCSLTLHSPVRAAIWCTFYCESPSFDVAGGCSANKADSPLGEPLPCLCVVDGHNMQIYGDGSEGFVGTLPVQVKRLWSTKFGILLERDKQDFRSEPYDTSPTVFSLTHPLDEVCPVAVAQGPVHLLDDPFLSIVFTSESPSICMVYNAHTAHHSVYSIRRIRSDELMEVSVKYLGPSYSMNISDRLKERGQPWEVPKGLPPYPNQSPFRSRAPSAASSHNFSHHLSRSQSSMATISRQSPAMSPLVTGSPWLMRSARLQSSVPNLTANTSSNQDVTTMNAFRHFNPNLCFEFLWSDDSSMQQDTALRGAASKVFLTEDLVGRSYLCYLIQQRSQLFIVRVDYMRSGVPSFGMVTSVTAKDAVAIPNLHLVAVLEYNGKVTLYSGLSLVGKLHIGGVLAQHNPPHVMHHLPQFNSPFPRRSTLLPHCQTPITTPRFDEHLISPVLPSSLNAPLSIDSSKIHLCGLRDPVEDRLTLQYSDGSYYRIALPTLAASSLVEDCLNALRQTLKKDIAIILLTKWYASRNAPGPEDISFEKEWSMFTGLLFDLIGYNNNDQCGDENSEQPSTPSCAAKRQRHSCNGSDLDWSFLVESEQHQVVATKLDHLLGFKKRSKRSTNSIRTSASPTINNKSLLYSSIKVVHYTLHLLYEELKLFSIRATELPYMAQLLSKLANDLNLPYYIVHYWRDFPELCPLKHKSKVNQEPKGFKNVIDWPCMGDKPDSIMDYVYDLLRGIDKPPFPYIQNVNVRTKDVVQLCGILMKGLRDPSSEVILSNLIRTIVPLREKVQPFSTPKGKVILGNGNVHERVVLYMAELGMTFRDLDTFPIGINFLLLCSIWKCRESPPSDWSAEAYNLVQRRDLAVQATLEEKSKTESTVNAGSKASERQDALPIIKPVDDPEQEDGMEDVDSALMKLRFPKDHRVIEARRLLQSSKPVTIALVQRPEVSDHDYIEEQEKHLYAVCARTMALPVGRGMFTLRTATPIITEPLSVPRLCLTGKAMPRGTTVELSHIDYPQNMQSWPLFHNGVSNGLRISNDASNIDSTWIVLNKPTTFPDTSNEHAGFLMALGLNRHLTNLSPFSTFEYLNKSSEMTSIGVLLGMSAAMKGTSDLYITKMLSIHVEPLLPPTSMDLEVNQNVQVAALLGVGLVYQGSAHRRMTEVLLNEIGRPPGPEMENSVDRESYSLAAGLALGLVTLKQGGRPSALSDLNVADMLHYYMVGGNKRPIIGSQRDKYKVPSFQIREGTSVNLDVTAPGATLALGLMYLGTGNKAIADWMTPPSTQYLLDFIRPDFLMLRVLSRGLIMWNDINPTIKWIAEQVPESIQPFCMVEPSPNSLDVDYESMNQAYCNIIAGACFAMGLKYAGTTNEEAFQTLLHYCRMFTSLTVKSIAELAGKPTIESCLNIILISVSMVMVGTGNLEIMRIVRQLRHRVGPASSAVVTYGSHMAIHMALGLLFLGGGRYTLSNSPASVAALICAFYPKFPTHSSDNRYYLQAFRHLYVLAVEPRLIILKDLITGRMCYASLRVWLLNGKSFQLRAPCLIPDLDTLSKLAVDDERYWPVLFERRRNWDQLLRCLQSSGFIDVKQRAGCLSYQEDKFGYRSELARTLTHSNIMPWSPAQKAIDSFSSDCIVRYFTDHFLTVESQERFDAKELNLVQTLTRFTYDCMIKDRLALLPILITMAKIINDIDADESTLQLWQFKIISVLASKTSLSQHLLLPETMLAMHQQVICKVDPWELELERSLRDFCKGECSAIKEATLRRLAVFVLFYSIPFNVASEAYNTETFSLLCDLNAQHHSAECVDKILKFVNTL